MSVYVAFLRAINVGGHNVKMKTLCDLFISLGLTNVTSFKASGNIIFETEKKENAKNNSFSFLDKKIEDVLYKSLGYEVKTFIRSIEEIKDLLKLNPFGKNEAGDEDTKTYVTFVSIISTALPTPPTQKLPIKSSDSRVEIIAIKNFELFCLSHKIDGKFGFPNGFLETKFKISATTRDWKTIKGIAELY